MLQRRYISGFTLLEILLVMVLLSLTAVMVVPTFPKSSNDDAKQEAERFYQLIQLWNEQSLLMSKVMGVRVDENGYSLMELSGNDWKKVEKQNRIATSIEMPEEIKLEIVVEGIDVDEEDQLFSRDSLFDEMVFTEEDKQKIDPPQLVMMGNGEIFAFNLVFSSNGTDLWKVTGTDIGIFELTSFDEDEE